MESSYQKKCGQPIIGNILIEKMTRLSAFFCLHRYLRSAHRSLGKKKENPVS